jgi:hypothetical protein
VCGERADVDAHRPLHRQGTRAHLCHCTLCAHAHTPPPPSRTQLFGELGRWALPVSDGAAFVGVVSVHDVVPYLVALYQVRGGQCAQVCAVTLFLFPLLSPVLPDRSRQQSARRQATSPQHQAVLAVSTTTRAHRSHWAGIPCSDWCVGRGGVHVCCVYVCTCV